MDPDLFQRMQDAARRFKAGESDFEEIMTPAGPAHLVRDPDDPRGFRIDFVGDGARRSVPVQEYPASTSRPPGYPAPLPFLQGCAATVDTRAQSVTWVDPPKPEEAFEHVVRQTLREGWVALESGTGAEPEASTRVFEKDDTERTVQMTSRDGLPHLVVRERRTPRGAS